ncbi:MAG: dihydroorotate dehydrogenase-like protein [Chitinivibrionales bacterium]|nr:dihydroorotate dehydrogenase-like protein [Chitinivibrionales bacterium]
MAIDSRTPSSAINPRMLFYNYHLITAFRIWSVFMANLQTTYLGLPVSSPVIAGASAMTGDPEKIAAMAQAGAGAIVIRSLFEEQILSDSNQLAFESGQYAEYPEALDYIQGYTRDNDLQRYVDVVKECKKAVDVPIIGSINCVTEGEWMSFAGKIQDAGADALELNIATSPLDIAQSPVKAEETLFDIIDSVRKIVSIPVAVKIGPGYTNLASIIRKIGRSGVGGIVLFMRFYTPDIDIDKMELTDRLSASSPAEYVYPLRWVGIASSLVSIDIAAGTGIHSADAVVKQILAGARVAYVVSTLYENGIEYLSKINRNIGGWMDSKGFATVEDFRGVMSNKAEENSVMYERFQYVKRNAGVFG